MDSEEPFSAEEALRVADAAIFAATGKHLNDVQTAILLGSLKQQTYTEIADAYRCTAEYLVQDAGPSFWKLLSQALGEKVSKKNFRTVLQRRSQQRTPTVDADEASLPDWGSSTSPDWGTSPSAFPFYGRDDELRQLKAAIQVDGCRLMTVFGVAGVGKTFLSVKLAQQVMDDFHAVVWRSLSNWQFQKRPPLISELLDDLSRSLSHQLGTAADSFFDYLTHHHCLIVLDGWETVLSKGVYDGSYRDDYRDYGDFLQQIGNAASVRGCLLITSQEKPKDVVNLEEVRQVCSFELRGLGEDAGREFFLPNCFAGSSHDIRALIRRCDGNPRLLSRIAAIVRQEFGGNVGQFSNHIRHDTIWGIYDLLSASLKRLSDVEYSVLTIIHHLTNKGESATVASILRDVVPTLSRMQLREKILPSLQRRSLLRVESRQHAYSLKPLVMEYINAQLLDENA